MKTCLASFWNKALLQLNFIISLKKVYKPVTKMQFQAEHNYIIGLYNVQRIDGQMLSEIQTNSMNLCTYNACCTHK